jgi:hypothetical protein
MAGGKQPREANHGEPLRYARGCRCDDCRRANAERLASYRATYGYTRKPADIEAEKRYEAKRKRRRQLERNALELERIATLNNSWSALLGVGK